MTTLTGFSKLLAPGKRACFHGSWPEELYCHNRQPHQYIACKERM